ncbi:hypothetical protein N7522_004913 [Penicillium canescens]|uniref:Uncharacterized protein n=1 Tax=Penicillium canescens TaxID=5083 RepID=A0AAD6I0K5_PENCN|nr:hypothetical protein N7522_004913 [Penicillium canescens]KAJ6026597.1 hypothetical protein N7460_011414 [Penicillium canescens]KAJ6039881.1 hypothetical protein N7444_008786 [Penicillium canescens]
MPILAKVPLHHKLHRFIHFAATQTSNVIRSHLVNSTEPALHTRGCEGCLYIRKSKVELFDQRGWVTEVFEHAGLSRRHNQTGVWGENSCGGDVQEGVRALRPPRQS